MRRRGGRRVRAGARLLAGRRALFVGTAKSVYVAPYGPVERTLLARARARLRARRRDRVRSARRRRPAEAPGNVIADLRRRRRGAGRRFVFGRWLGLLPGSRESAYADAVRLARVLAALAARRGSAQALLSLAPGLAPARFADALGSAGWALAAGDGGDVAFRASRDGASIVGWRGAVGTVLRSATLVAGQAGTANEQAAALGRPVVALDAEGAARAGRRERAGTGCVSGASWAKR